MSCRRVSGHYFNGRGKRNVDAVLLWCHVSISIALCGHGSKALLILSNDGNDGNKYGKQEACHDDTIELPSFNTNVVIAP